MSWYLKAWWGYRTGSSPKLDEEFDTKAEGLTRVAEILANGYTVSSPGAHLHYPASGIMFVSLVEDAE